MIMEGDLAPGSNHLEAELAEALGLSRTPVREAALRLAHEGLVTVRPRKGVRVCELTPRDMTDIYDILTELECLAAGRAAARRPSPADLAPLTTATDRMEAALHGGDLDAWAAADDRFHRALAALGDNARMSEIVARLYDQAYRARRLTLRLRPPPAASTRDHRALLEAIATGAADTARAIHRTHCESARGKLLEIMEAHALRRL